MYCLYLVLKYTLHRCMGHTTLADKRFWILFFLWFCVLGISPIILLFILLFLLKNTWSANCEIHILNNICKGLQSLLHCNITFPDNPHWNFSFFFFWRMQEPKSRLGKIKKKLKKCLFFKTCALF